ncbi:hypothetical protein TRAPUB_10986, partial [Trametes pubescens]
LLKEYNTVHWLVTQVSGFGWDEDLKKVTVTDNVWDDFLKKHTKVTKYRTRGFPLYDCIAALVEGKQATGEQALRIENVTSTSRPSTATPSASKGSRQPKSSTSAANPQAWPWPLFDPLASIRPSIRPQQQRQRLSFPLSQTHQAYEGLLIALSPSFAFSVAQGFGLD